MVDFGEGPAASAPLSIGDWRLAIAVRDETPDKIKADFWAFPGTRTHRCSESLQAKGFAPMSMVQFPKREPSHKGAVLKRIRSWPLTALLAGAALLQPGALPGEQVAVRHPEGTARGFLVLRTLAGKTLAAGDLIQVSQGNRIVSNLIFHFKDGSVDDETVVFTQRRNFRLLSDHHVQKGPSFPHPMDVLIDASNGQVTVRSTDGGNEKVETDHLDLPPDLANGLLLYLLKNLRTAGETKVSYVAATPKPRLVKLAILSQGEETFWAAGVRRRVTRYNVKIELGGLTGVVAPLIGKQPDDIHVWILGGKAPTFVRMEGQFYQGGPVWAIQLASPLWPRSQNSGK